MRGRSLAVLAMMGAAAIAAEETIDGKRGLNTIDFQGVTPPAYAQRHQALRINPANIHTNPAKRKRRKIESASRARNRK